jgi:hypothetical protein
MSLPVQDPTLEGAAVDEHRARRHALLRARLGDVTGARAVGATAIGSLALGAFALGALAIGALAIGRLAVGRARIRRLEIDELVVRRLRVLERIDAAKGVPTT